MTKRIFTPRVRQILDLATCDASKHGIDERHRSMIENARTYTDLRIVAQASLRKMKKMSSSGEIVFFSGPLRSGPKTLEQNMQIMWSAIKSEEKKVFNQLLFFPKLIKLEVCNPELNPMTEFFIPVLDMGKITELSALVGCEKSPNSQMEIKTALNLKLIVS